VDMNCSRKAPVALATVGGPLADLFQAGKGRAQIEARVVLGSAGQQAVEDVNDGPRLHRTNAAAFVQRCHKEGSASLLGEGAADLLNAEAISVGLDDSGALGLA